MNDKTFILLLLEWYRKFGRTLPWRGKKNHKIDPYWVWISEIMLQQTTVQTVKSRFVAFINRWPTVEELAKASLDEVLHEWQGLGYYNRAHNLHKCAKIIVENFGGIFPTEAKELIKLPGIGQYTSSALAAIAFNRSVIAIDVNVDRVFSRLFALKEKPSIRRKIIILKSKNLVNKTNSNTVSQALMDFGSIICKLKKPLCSKCILINSCESFSKGLVEKIPISVLRKKKQTRYGVIFWVENADGLVLLQKRPNKGLYGGMMEFPSTPWQEKKWDFKTAKKYSPIKTKWHNTKIVIRHSLTHFDLVLYIYSGKIKIVNYGLWVNYRELNNYALPTVMKKIVDVFKSKITLA